MKAIGLAETVIGQPFDRRVQPEDEDGFDDTSALATLRSSGITLFADDRALELLQTFDQSAKANTAATGNPPPGTDTRFFAEDLNRGYRLDIWDSTSNEWRSLHARNAVYNFGDLRLPSDDDDTLAEEGFVQLAATTPSTKDGTQASTDLYLHEAIARWGGWSLSAPRPGKALSRYGDPEKAVPPDDPDDPDYVINPVGRTVRRAARVHGRAGNTSEPAFRACVSTARSTRGSGRQRAPRGFSARRLSRDSSRPPAATRGFAVLALSTSAEPGPDRAQHRCRSAPRIGDQPHRHSLFQRRRSQRRHHARPHGQRPARRPTARKRRARRAARHVRR